MKMIVHQIASAYLQAICLLEELIVGLRHDSEHALLINSTEMGVFNCAFVALRPHIVRCFALERCHFGAVCELPTIITTSTVGY